ncbi:hypothetical protein [Bdellovibrio sp. HCB337]|uniref:hypothetical protein n=1 Tax=Bdellovibrio sp. HCB337 TaxID=3394358 RepID=UPI0039A5B469
MKDFESFLESGHAQLPTSALENLKKEIFPSLSLVATKLGLIHLFSSVVTLMLCPQFGFRLFFDGHGLMHYFMAAGSVACFGFCGAFYLGTSFWLAKIFLGEFEWVVLRKNSVLALGSVSLLSLGVLSMLGHELSFEVGFVWLLGALVSAAIPLLTQVHHRPLMKI